jgi:hypothetical protein
VTGDVLAEPRVDLSGVKAEAFGAGEDAALLAVAHAGLAVEEEVGVAFDAVVFGLPVDVFVRYGQGVAVGVAHGFWGGEFGGHVGDTLGVLEDCRVWVAEVRAFQAILTLAFWAGKACAFILIEPLHKRPRKAILNINAQTLETLVIQSLPLRSLHNLQRLRLRTRWIITFLQ